MPVYSTAAAVAAAAAAGGCRSCGGWRSRDASGNGFPHFLPKEVERIRDPQVRELAKRIQRIPVKISLSENPIMSSCLRPIQQKESEPVVLLHGFDSSCLEWRYTYPLLEGAGLETWAVDILGWGFCDLKTLPSFGVASKREHFYQLWRSYIQRPMILVGPSLGAAVAIDFTVNHPEAVARLVLIDASVYSEGTGNLSKLPRVVAYAGVSLLKSIPLRLYANTLAFKNVSLSQSFDWTNVGRLHCLLPWWEDATVHFMISGGYNVKHQIKQVKQKTLIIWGEDDRIVSSEIAMGLVARMKKVHRQFDGLLDRIIAEHRARLSEKASDEGFDFLGVLIKAKDGDRSLLSDADIKPLLQNMFAAGTDTTANTVEMAMAELIRHPPLLAAAHRELDAVVGRSRLVSERDLPCLPFLDAVIKETFRLHPAAPLSLPRTVSSDCQIDGFHIPKSSTLLINIWAIARDPAAWPDPDPLAFRPDRFLPGGPSHGLDVKGCDFGLLPFGAGRRICAGMSLGLRMVHFMTAALVHAFDWELPEGAVADDLDMGSSFGLTLHKTHPLKVRPVPRLLPEAYLAP